MKGEAMEVRDASSGYAPQVEMPVVPEGYKQTDAGVIPKDWDVRTVFDIADRSKSRFDDGDWVEAEHITSEGVRLVQTGNIGVGKYIEKSNKKYIYESSFEKLKCKELKVEDLLICRLAEPAGRACVLPDIGESKVITSVDVTIFRPREEVADGRFLVQYFSTREWFDSVLNSVGGTTHKRISRGALGKLPVPFPSITEQRAIATALSDVDALLETLDRLIAKKRDIKQAAMQQLLTAQTRLPGFEAEWKEKRLGELGDFLKGSGVRRDQAQSGSLPCVRYGEIYTVHHDVIREFQSWIARDVAATAVRIQKGDLLFAGSGETKDEIGKCVAVVTDKEAYAGGDIVILRAYETDPVFMGYALNQHDVNLQKSSFGQGDAVVHISASALSQIVIKLPPESEQSAIASVLSAMDAELEALEQRRAKTAALKQAMMQELLTGRTRLVERGTREEALHG